MNDLMEKNKHLELKNDYLWKIIEDQSNCIKKGEEVQRDQKQLIEEAFETIRTEMVQPSAPTMTALQTQRDHCNQSSQQFLQHMQRIQEHHPAQDHLYPVLQTYR
jgi:hypothetical protein